MHALAKAMLKLVDMGTTTHKSARDLQSEVVHDIIALDNWYFVFSILFTT